MSDPRSEKHRVVIAGSGIAGLEALSALSALAGDLVDITVVSPATEFAVEALAVATPFNGRGIEHFSVASIAAVQGAHHVLGSVARVDADRNVVVCSDSAELEYDSLLLTVGATARLPLAGRTIYFRGSHDAAQIEAMLDDVLAGTVRSIVFSVPPGPTRPIPIYELALETAAFARENDIWNLQMTIITPEQAPLELFGRGASFGIERLLDRSRIELITGARVHRTLSDSVLVRPSGILCRADHVVAVPQLAGPAIPGVTADADGFLEATWSGRTPTPDVFAAGDGTVFPIKHGGVSARHAYAAATEIAARAGADITPVPLSPEIVAEIATGRGTVYLGGDFTRTSWKDDMSELAGAPLEHEPRKVDAPFLYARLQELEPGCDLALS